MNREEGAGLRTSVVLEERQQVVAAVVGQVGGAQVGQQLVRVGQLRQELDDGQRGTGCEPRRNEIPGNGLDWTSHRRVHSHLTNDQLRPLQGLRPLPGQMSCPTAAGGSGCCCSSGAADCRRHPDSGSRERRLRAAAGGGRSVRFAQNEAPEDVKEETSVSIS